MDTKEPVDMPKKDSVPPQVKDYIFLAENPSRWFYRNRDDPNDILELPKVKDWAFLGLGSYNFAYRRDDEVLKTQRFRVQSDTPERSVRLWNVINPTMKARLEHTAFGQAWVSPFITGRQATDKEMFSAVIDIFNRTGRIVVDAMATENFKTLPTGEVICVDIGMALQLEQREDEHVENDIRRQSLTSLQTWHNLSKDYAPFFLAYIPRYPETVNALKALLFIKSYRPDINQADFLKTNPRLIDKLSKAYDEDLPIDTEALDDLEAALHDPEALRQYLMADSQAKLDAAAVALHDMKSPPPNLEGLQAFLMETQKDMLSSPQPEQIQAEIMKKIDAFLTELLEDPAAAGQEPAALQLVEALKSPSFDSTTKSKMMKAELEEAKKLDPEESETPEGSPPSLPTTKK